MNLRETPYGVKERPMLMSAPMVRAILDGRKTMTRRVVKPQPFTAPLAPGERYVTDEEYRINAHERRFPCPYGQPGDRLWVRETFYETESAPFADGKVNAEFLYRADGDFDGDMHHAGCKWQPSIHMPRRASRITLEITAVRVERLQDISEQDAYAEGCFALGDCECTAVAQFRSLWESINGPGSWALNPWVWVIEFRRVTT